MNTPLEILRAARRLITSEDAWAQGDYAFDEQGNHVAWDNPVAVRYCTLGAIFAVAGHSHDSADQAVKCLHPAIESDHVATFNDSHTHAEVLAAFDKAIALVETQGAPLTVG